MLSAMFLPATPSYFLVLEIFILILSVVTALLEIQIEGPNGWAAKLPTWRYNSSWVRIFYNGKELTGYHLYLNLHLLLLLHLPLLISGWSWFLECTLISLYFAYMVFWDFLWFALNPAYGMQCFKKGNVWWFDKWIGPFPMDYYIMLGVSGFFAFLRGTSEGALSDPWLDQFPLPAQHVIAWAISISMVIGLIAFVVRFIAPFHPKDFCVRIVRPIQKSTVVWKREKSANPRRKRRSGL